MLVLNIECIPATVEFALLPRVELVFVPRETWESGGLEGTFIP